jgi:hypothetical protein
MSDAVPPVTEHAIRLAGNKAIECVGATIWLFEEAVAAKQDNDRLVNAVNTWLSLWPGWFKWVSETDGVIMNVTRGPHSIARWLVAPTAHGCVMRYAAFVRPVIIKASGPLPLNPEKEFRLASGFWFPKVPRIRSRVNAIRRALYQKVKADGGLKAMRARLDELECEIQIEVEKAVTSLGDGRKAAALLQGPKALGDVQRPRPAAAKRMEERAIAAMRDRDEITGLNNIRDAIGTECGLNALRVAVSKSNKLLKSMGENWRLRLSQPEGSPARLFKVPEDGEPDC